MSGGPPPYGGGLLFFYLLVFFYYREVLFADLSTWEKGKGSDGYDERSEELTAGDRGRGKVEGLWRRV